jgi:hypothetical protein
MMLIWEVVQVTTAEITPHWKKPLKNAVTLKDAVVLLGVVGVLQKEMIW